METKKQSARFFLPGLGKLIDRKDGSRMKRDLKVVKYPITGELVKWKNVPDAAYSSLREDCGIAIKPYKGEVAAPADGILKRFLPAGNGLVMEMENGGEILIHVGLKTGNLSGKYFEPLVKEGEQVTKGQALLKFDLEKIEKAGYSLVTPVVVTDGTNYKKIIETGEEKL